MAVTDQRRGDDATALELHFGAGLQSMIDQGILTKTAFHVAAVVTLTERSSEDDLEAVPEFITWATIGDWLGKINAASRWWIGDWLAFGEGAWGERYAQAAEKTGLDIGTLQNYAYVCRQVMPSRRREELSFTAHLKVAKLEPTQQIAWLDHAVRNGLRSKELEQEIRDSGGTVPTRRVAETAEPETRRDPEPHVNTQQVVTAAMRVWKDAQRDGDSYRVPVDTFAVLATALGKGD